MPFPTAADTRTPGAKLMLAVLIAGLLTIPLFATYLLIFDRENQSQTAEQSIVSGWGGAQHIAAPLLVIPYSTVATVTGTDNGQAVTRTSTVWRELSIAPDVADLTTTLAPERRHRSIYDAVIYQTALTGRARYSLPADLARLGIARDALALDRAELRFDVAMRAGWSAHRRRSARTEADWRSNPVSAGRPKRPASMPGSTPRRSPSRRSRSISLISYAARNPCR